MAIVKSCAPNTPRYTLLGARMNYATRQPAYQESRIEDEPILGPVLQLPDGRVQPLTWFERVLVTLHLIDAKGLEARYFGTAASS
jgi:hypothetical protein